MRQQTRQHSLQSLLQHQQGAAGRQAGGKHVLLSRLQQPAAHQQQQQQQQQAEQTFWTWLWIMSSRTVPRVKQGSLLPVLLMLLMLLQQQAMLQQQQCVKMLMKASGSCLQRWLQLHVLM
jgi:hypothetical protein